MAGNSRSLAWLLLAVLIYATARIAAPVGELAAPAQAVLGISAAAVILWVASALPLGTIALIVLVMLGVTPTGRAAAGFSGFASPVIFFLIGAVALGTAVETTGLAARMARLLMRTSSGSPARLYVQIVAALPAMAFILPSAISRNAILIPACRDTLAAMDMRGNARSGRALMLALGVLNPLASSALLTGGITSMTASAMVGGFTWLGWFAAMALPYYLLIGAGAVALRLMVGRFERADCQPPAEAERVPLGSGEIKTLAVTALVSGLWLTDSIHGLSPAVPALLGAVILVCPGLGVLGWKDFEAKLSWGLILTVGASLSLAEAMIRSGAADWLAGTLVAALSSGSNQPLVVMAALLLSATTVHIAITNLAACVALLIPVTMTVGQAAGINPVVCALAVTVIVDSVILYPVQTASNLLAYETGYFDARDVALFGAIMLVLTLIVGLFVAVPYWGVLGLSLTLR